MPWPFAFIDNAQEDDQTQGDGPKSADEIAKELANPNTVLGTMNLNFDYVHYQGDLPDAGSQNSFGIGFQPTLPIPLSKTVNLYVRPDIPIVVRQPTFNGTSFESQKVGLGNISADIAVGKTFPSKFIGVIGAFASFRTASDEALRSPYTFVGPELVVAKLFKWGAAGIMVNHAWNVSKFDPNTATSDGIYSISNDVFINNSTGGETAQITAGQYFYVVSMGNGWQITGSPTYSINHNAPKGRESNISYCCWCV